MVVHSACHHNVGQFTSTTHCTAGRHAVTVGEAFTELYRLQATAVNAKHGMNYDLCLFLINQDVTELCIEKLGVMVALPVILQVCPGVALYISNANV